ncbi:MAG: VOC family protein [Gammaproteobacteria bacterium]|nr:VOC family protein [Gammaproteobacteria bacterium]
MKRSRWAWILFVLAAAATQAAELPAPTLLRTTLIVADVDRSIAFYRLLGFEVESDRGGPRKPDSPFPLAAKSGKFRLVILASADPAGGRIGLLAFGEPSPPVLVPPRDQVGIGDMVFGIRAPVDFTDSNVAAASGATLVVPVPVSYVMKRPDGSVGQGRLFHVFDPDGRLVEVMAPTVDAPPAGK